MIFAYPAIFKETAPSSFEGRFPDLPGLAVTGASLDGTIQEAIELLRRVITAELTEEEDPQMPRVSHVDDVIAEEGEIVRLISCNVRLDTGWAD